MSAPRRWARRAALALAGGGLTAAGLGGALPGGALGAEAPTGSTGTGEGTTPPVTETSPQAPAPAQGASGSTSGAPTTTSTAPASSAPPASETSTGPSGAATAPTEVPAATEAVPTVVVQRKQRVTHGRRGAANATKGGSGTEIAIGGAGSSQAVGEGAPKNGPSTVPAGTPNGVAPAPLAAGGELNPALPQGMLFAGSAVSAQALDFYRIPLFLLPIYQAAAFQYDVPWQILAAINEVETNYGTDLSVSTAGAVGWMQFMPTTWLQYGVDATNAGYADPNNPTDAIFAAARYLHAAGASRNLHAAILAYNHSQEYVESVLLRARLIASFPRSVIGTLTGLVDGRVPTLDARVATGASDLGGASRGGAGGGSSSAPSAESSPADSAASGSSSATAGAVPAGDPPTPAAAGDLATGSAQPGAADAGSGASAATAAATRSGSAASAQQTAGTAATSDSTATAGSAATPGSTPAPSPQVAARRAEAAANAPAKATQLVELLGLPGAPAVAVENGRIVHLGRSHALGRYVVLRDIYGDVFTYAGLGSIAPRYRPSVPKLDRSTQAGGASEDSAAAAQGAGVQGEAKRGAAKGVGSGQSAVAGSEPPRDPAPTQPASAGHQRPVTLKVRSHAAQGLAPASAPLESEGETAPRGMGRVRLFAHPGNPVARTAAARAAKLADAGNSGWLTLRTGSIVSVGTVLGHLDTPVGATAGRLRFAVRPAGDNGTINPQPLLANWRQLGVALHPKGSSGAATLLGATAGDALLMTKGELERAVLSDPGIQLDACGRRDVTAGAVDGRVLALLAFLSRSGLQPTVAALRCSRDGTSPSGLSVASSTEALTARAAHDGGTAVDISAINGIPIASHQGAGTIADAAIRTLLTLRGRFAPQRIVSLMSYPQAPTTQAQASAWDHIHIDFPPRRHVTAHAAAAGPTAASPLAVTGDLNESQWSQLIARIAGLPMPTVASKPGATAIRDPQAALGNRDLGARGLSAGP